MEFDEGIPAEEILQVDLRFAKHLVECAREARRDAEDRVELVETAMGLLGAALKTLKENE